MHLRKYIFIDLNFSIISQEFDLLAAKVVKIELVCLVHWSRFKFYPASMILRSTSIKGLLIPCEGIYFLFQESYKIKLRMRVQKRYCLTLLHTSFNILVKAQEEIMWKRILEKESMHLMASKEVRYRRNINLLLEHLAKPKHKKRKESCTLSPIQNLIRWYI